MLATLLYRLFSYWLPLPAGLVASFLFRHRHRDDQPEGGRALFSLLVSDVIGDPLDVIASGTTAPDTGTITMRGQLVERLTPSEATRLGIAIVHQHPAVLPDMTVAENVGFGLEIRKRPKNEIKQREVKPRVITIEMSA